MADGGFQLTPKQEEALELLTGPATHILLEGGSRSGKTFMLVRSVIIRALHAAASRHLIARFRFVHVKNSIVLDTFPKVMGLCFPEVDYHLDKQSWFVTLPGGSEIWFGGLDDKERTEKILGSEFATVYLNECSQISWQSRSILTTRMAQKAQTSSGHLLPLRAYYDANPPTKGHWLYRVFHTHTNPDTKQRIDPHDYVRMLMNPVDNLQNLPPGYMKQLDELTPRLRDRFRDGKYGEAAPGALFDETMLEKWRLIDEELPQLLRVVVAVDPSGADDDDNLENDEIGIVVCALGVNGVGYVLEDLTCKCGPATWGKVATDAFDRHRADRIVAEVNFGGAMVSMVIRQARPRTPFRPVTASRGKAIRAEPIAALMEAGKIRLAGLFPQLEDELCAMTTHGYIGENSPNRADAMIWGMSDLFPELTREAPVPKPKTVEPIRRGSWQHTL